MSIPNLPTDSLYKFAALGFLAAAFVAAIALESIFDNLEAKRFEIDTELSVLETDVGFLKEQADEWAKQSVSPSTRETLLANVHEMKRTVTKVRAKERWRKSIDGRLTVLLLFGWIGIPLCLALSALSFRLWFLRVQKPQDELLQRKLRDNRISAHDDEAT